PGERAIAPGCDHDGSHRVDPRCNEDARDRGLPSRWRESLTGPERASADGRAPALLEIETEARPARGTIRQLEAASGWRVLLSVRRRPRSRRTHRSHH